MYKCLPISTKLGKNVYDLKILNEFDYGFNWTQATRVICPLIRVGAFDLVYTPAPTCIYGAH